ncbi:OsmC family protein [Actinosynnema pretiosum subsp. pretiosum]|uniref:OsmC family protein n=3 Tax=Actinosynnema TaxID=40566 RepID=C6WE97_ACTMD|nr:MULTISPECIES: OsmC family protein [Actinosynnema]ACU35840.1 OsmC family protein [Actinosynnema mirum DSM 43827]ATE53490.1 organic hydroperoxide resistance protein [Actinosynnema pretiosum]AXX29264.1 Organic hydroperoxide resistance protein [Actinosynnema pretiosum subsp. pretiosum]QUF06475.1 OsmC family protein [Actinosynnema pretiosum subsp. pretiosum]
MTSAGMTAAELHTSIATAAEAGVVVDGAESGELPTGLPAHLGGRGGGWAPEDLYAAALASCLHQTVVRMAASGGHSTTGSSVSAAVGLRHDGAERLDFEVRFKVELPGVADEAARRDLVDLSVSHCPMVGGWPVDVA